ncbi:MAG: UvrD-helicase domain-containing protein [Sedimentisphaerales bacterium]|nr:UvrD-helicase domain-containing protein [Sedimentisphaerales bacterium]
MDEILQQLTPSQRKAVCHKEGPLLVIAGPGSGKTRVITHRIAALIEAGVRPYNICAITFTNKAAEEMRQRAFTLGASGGAHISTFHSLCVRILRRYASQAEIKPNFSIYDESDQIRCMKQAVKDCRLDAGNFSPARMLGAVSTLKNKLIDAESFRNEAEDFFTTRLSEIYLAYQNILGERNGLDFDDLLMKTAFLLEDCPDVCDELNERFKFLLIDEYQDTNHAQYRIAKALVSRHNNICATGDPDQSIYRWRGADIRNILAFEHDWPDATVVKLEENFRSAANILAEADALIAYNRNRKQKKLVPTKPASRDVSITACEDEIREAQAVAQQINELAKQGASLKDIAVFYRVNAMSRVLEEALLHNQISYQIVRGIEFYRRREIRDLLAYLKILVNPDDEIALLRIINIPARGIGKVTIEKVQNYAARHKVSFYEALKKVENIEALSKAAKAKILVFVSMIEKFRKDMSGPVAQLSERVFNESGLAQSLQAAGPEGQNDLENVGELINAATQYDQNAEEPSLLDYIQQISLFSDTDAYDASSESVSLMTLHAAKGLEFENVFIVGIEEGLLPHERTNASEDEDELEEERRLLFVGITRAKSGLHISYSRYRTVRGQLLRTIPSRFLLELLSGIDEQSEDNIDYDDNDDVDCEDMPCFELGQLVRHKTFGLGRVQKYIDMGQNSVIVVKFNSGMTKSLMVQYANLSKIDL